MNTQKNSQFALNIIEKLRNRPDRAQLNTPVRRSIREIWPVIGAVFLDTVLLMGLVPLLPQLEQSGGLSTRMIGFLVAAYSLSGVLLCLPLGLASDRWRPRPIFLIGIFGAMVSAAVLAVSPSAAGIGLGRFMQGIASAAVWTSGMVLASEHFGPGKRSLAVASIFSAASMGELVGPVASGFLSERFGVSVFFWVTAGCVAGLIFFYLRHPHRTPPGSHDPDVAPEEDLGGPKSWSALVSVGALSLILFIVFTMILLLIPFKLNRELGFGPVEIGLAFAGWNLLMIGAQLAAAQFAAFRGSRLALGIGMAVLVLGLAMLGLSTTLWRILAALYLSSIGIGLASTVATAQFSETWERLRLAGTGLGTAFGAANTVWSLGFLSGNLAGGWLLNEFPMKNLFFSMAIILVPFLFGVAAAPLIRRSTTDLTPVRLPIDRQEG